MARNRLIAKGPEENDDAQGVEKAHKYYRLACIGSLIAFIIYSLFLALADFNIRHIITDDYIKMPAMLLLFITSIHLWLTFHKDEDAIHKDIETACRSAEGEKFNENKQISLAFLSFFLILFIIPYIGIYCYDFTFAEESPFFYSYIEDHPYIVYDNATRIEIEKLHISTLYHNASTALDDLIISLGYLKDLNAEYPEPTGKNKRALDSNIDNLTIKAKNLKSFCNKAINRFDIKSPKLAYLNENSNPPRLDWWDLAFMYINPLTVNDIKANNFSNITNTSFELIDTCGQESKYLKSDLYKYDKSNLTRTALGNIDRTRIYKSLLVRYDNASKIYRCIDKSINSTLSINRTLHEQTDRFHNALYRRTLSNVELFGIYWTDFALFFDIYIHLITILMLSFFFVYTIRLAYLNWLFIKKIDKANEIDFFKNGEVDRVSALRSIKAYFNRHVSYALVTLGISIIVYLIIKPNSSGEIRHMSDFLEYILIAILTMTVFVITSLSLKRMNNFINISIYKNIEKIDDKLLCKQKTCAPRSLLNDDNSKSHQEQRAILISIANEFSFHSNLVPYISTLAPIAPLITLLLSRKLL